MSKSKKQRQQEKHVQTQAQKQDKKLQMTQNVQPEKTTVEKTETASADPAQDIKMNFYSAMSMLTTLVAAASAVIAMIVAGRGFYYILQTMYDETQTDIVLLGDNLVTANFNPSIRTFLYISGLVLALQVVLSLVETVTAINPRKKPVFPVAVIMTVLSLTANILYFLGHEKTKEIANVFSYVEVHEHTGLYTVYLYVLIVNVVCSVINLLGQLYGMKLYKKTGCTC